MKVLLDTATFLWITLAPHHLSATAVDLYQDSANEVYLSAAAAYEIIVKTMLGKLDLGAQPSAFVRSERESRGIWPLAVDEESAFAVERLPALHSDPFDRLMIAQSIVHGITLLTPDKQIARYPIRSTW